MAKSNLAVRLLSAAVAGPLLLLVMFLGPAWAWYLVVLLATVLAAHELFAMTHPGDVIAQTLGVAGTALVSFAIYKGSHSPAVLLAVVVLCPILGSMVVLLRVGDLETAALRMMTNMAVPLYVGGLLAIVALLRRDLAEVGPHYTLLALMLAWLGDTGAYFVGRKFGRTKLYERVSPKKTRAGFVGAMLGSAVGALIASFGLLSLPVLHALILGVLAGALGQLGDLSESLLKRSTGIKDSGALIPGHGGILDRVDALLIVAPLVYWYACTFGLQAGVSG